MNRKKLIQHLEALEELARRLRADLASSGEGDAFAVLIYHARQKAHYWTEHDKTKHARHIVQHVDSTYIEARALGFRGDKNAWRAVLWAHPDQASVPV